MQTSAYWESLSIGSSPMLISADTETLQLKGADIVGIAEGNL